MAKFPSFKQLGAMDCGATSLRMIAKFYGKEFSINYLKKITEITKEGVSFLTIVKAAEKIKLSPKGYKVDYSTLVEKQIVPCIVHWNQNHFVVVYKATNKHVYVADPAKGRMKYLVKDFMSSWADESGTGVAIFIQPTQDFFDQELEPYQQTQNKSLLSLLHFVKVYKKYYVQLFLGLIVGSLILLISPFLTQAIVDKGINNLDMNFIYLILLAQLLFFVGSISVEIFRRWILLHIGMRLVIGLVSDFLKKLLKLPIGYFETHMAGDIVQRIAEHKRIEDLLTVKSMMSLLSLINVLLFSIVLFFYDVTVLVVFFTASFLSVGWVSLFLGKRKQLDFQRAEYLSRHTDKIYEIIKGAKDIKLSNSADQKRWEWEDIQSKLFKVSLKQSSHNELQNIGSKVIDRLKTLGITVISSSAVINGDLSLGGMFAVNMIVGQLNAPFNDLLGFVTVYYDAKLAFERIEDVKNEKVEADDEKQPIKEIPSGKNIELINVSFKYPGNSNYVLKNLNINIPAGKVTAIVGASGSGKSTLLKLLLKFYRIEEGEMKLGHFNMNQIHPDNWRDRIGVVLQEGTVFADTILKNITVGQEIDGGMVAKAADMACIHDFIKDSLPVGYETLIGDRGMSLSGGQKQRMFMARAIYKNPDYFFLDEATSALDTSTEKRLVENLDKFYDGKTVVVIAHRLSTIRNADQIVVLDQGCVSEVGTHDDLVKLGGYYYKLVKDQIELGG